MPALPDPTVGPVSISTDDVAHCTNCNAPLTGDYCSACGQSRRSPLVSLRAFTGEIIDQAVSLDSRLLRSLHALMLRPGHLTREHIDGRRIRYTAPFQIYLLAAAFFFFIASLRPFIWVDTERLSFVAVLPGMLLSNNVADGTLRQLQQSGTPIDVFAERFIDAVTALLPTFLIGSVLLFSIAVALLNHRRQRYFVAHAVFAIHWTAFYLIVSALLRLLPPEWMAVQVITLLIGIAWLVVALRRTYGGGITLNATKAVVIVVIFLFVFVAWVQSAVAIGTLLVRP